MISYRQACAYLLYSRWSLCVITDKVASYTWRLWCLITDAKSYLWGLSICVWIWYKGVPLAASPLARLSQNLRLVVYDWVVLASGLTSIVTIVVPSLLNAMWVTWGSMSDQSSDDPFESEGDVTFTGLTCMRKQFTTSSISSISSVSPISAMTWVSTVSPMSSVSGWDKLDRGRYQLHTEVEHKETMPYI